MYIIGLIANEEDAKSVRKKLNYNKIISINKNNINNLRNVKFTIIVINKNIKESEQYEEEIINIIDQTKYVLINSDSEFNNKLIKNKKSNIITYGINPKSTITVSSVNEEEILISIQREIENIKGRIIEVQEKKNIKTNNINICLLLNTIELILY